MAVIENTTNSPLSDLPKVSVIISTYNSEAWLEKVLWGYNCQTAENFEVIIADDGSGQLTRDLIDRMKREVKYTIRHVWQEDEGFQKSRILNKSVLVCKADYIIMSDGDCIPRGDFVQVHLNNRKKGFFLSGGYFMLSMDISEKITKEDIVSQKCFDIEWLEENGLKSSFKNNKIKAKGLLRNLLNFVTPTKSTWNGHNASGWKADIIEVNGFDERMQYGGQDRELGERLINLGIKSKQIRYSAICVHLDHKRSYKTPESIIKNVAIRKKTKEEKIIWNPFGIQKGEKPPTVAL